MKKNKGFVLIYAVYAVTFIFILILLWYTLNYSMNNKIVNHSEEIYQKTYLEAFVNNYACKSLNKNKIGIGYFTLNNLYELKLERYEDDYIIYGRLMKYPDMVYYQIFHNGFADKTDYQYFIYEEGYL